jgi:hypothetical protein
MIRIVTALARTPALTFAVGDQLVVAGSPFGTSGVSAVVGLAMIGDLLKRNSPEQTKTKVNSLQPGSYRQLCSGNY